jgi:hypothetical protein
MDKEETNTEEKLENAIEKQPGRYLETRNSNGKLIEVQDKDTGRLWKRLSEGHWIFVD